MGAKNDKTTTNTSGTGKTNQTSSNTGVNTSTGVTSGVVSNNQQNGPLAQQLPFFQNLWQQAQEAFGQTNGQKFGGSLYAAPNALQTGAVSAINAAAPGMGQGVDELRNLATSQLRGDWLDPATNPYIKNVADAALAPVQDRFNQNKLAISDRAIAQGAYGGSRQDLQELQALDDFSKTSGNITSGIYANNYANERGIQQNSGQLLDQANLLALAGPQAQLAGGALQQGWQQGGLDAELKKFQMDQAAPWSGMSELANILTAGGFGSNTGSTTSTGTQNSTSTSTGTQTGVSTGTSTGQSTGTDTSKFNTSGTNVSTPPPTNPLLGVLQGLMGGGITGANLATGIGGVAAGAGLGAFAPWMLPFAALGGLAGAL
jgi:hypothetical protein